jgi:hypothetical protein
MSKAFTREDDVGLDEPVSGPPRTTARVARTRLGARLLRDALARAIDYGDTKQASVL